ncbi:hypothetical protein K8I28_01590 [bacterium]|nr:hypothetical protein [bacterium]
MSVLQVLFFLLVAIVMSGLGLLLLVQPIRKSLYDSIYKGVAAAFASKMGIGLLAIALSLKVFGWQSNISAFGVLGAYIIALFVTTLAALSALKRGREKS